jgi:outer membrane biosynthesis protein TonB
MHVLILGLIAVPILKPERPIFAEPIYQVAIVEWPDPNYEPPKPVRTPPPTPEPAPETRKPPQEEAVPVPSKPKKEVTKKPDPPKPKQPDPVETPPVKAEAPDAPEDPVSLGIVDQKDFRHDWYLEQLRAILARAWNPPDGGSGLLATAVHFNILRGGVIVEPEIVGPSGWSLYDRAALGAVLSVKLPPLPESYDGEQLGLTVNFKRMGQEP